MNDRFFIYLLHISRYTKLVSNYVCRVYHWYIGELVDHLSNIFPYFFYLKPCKGPLYFGKVGETESYRPQVQLF